MLRFSIGFGRVLWRRQPNPNGTEFVLSAVPFGGYVEMVDDRNGPVAAADLPHALGSKPLWQRAAIVLAGPVANLLLAIALYAAAHWVGMDEPKAVIAAPEAGSAAEKAGLHGGDWVRAISKDGATWSDIRSLTELRWQITQAVVQGEDLELLVSDRSGRGQHKAQLQLKALGEGDVDAATLRRVGLGNPYSEPVLGEVAPTGAGAAAGLRAGDRVLAIDGRPVADAAQLRETIRASVAGTAAVPMRWLVERQGVRSEIAVLPAVVLDGGRRVGRLDLAPGQRPEIVTVRYGPLEGLGRAVVQTWETSALTVRMLGRIVTGRASLKNLSGPISIADYAGQSVRLGLTYYLGFLAVVSVSLGVLNLLPLPVLDGGQLMYYLFEAVTGRPVSGLWLVRLQQSGFAIIFVMMFLALYNDVTRIVGLQ